MVFLTQRRMIYLPRSYDTRSAAGLPPGIVELEAVTASGRQVSFCVPPRDDPSRTPEFIWAVLGGNASLALDMKIMLRTVARRFLM